MTFTYPSHTTKGCVPLSSDAKEIRLIPQILNYWRRSNVAYLKIKPKAIILGAKMISSDKDIFVEAAVKAGDIVIYEAVLNDSQPGYEIGFQEIDL